MPVWPFVIATLMLGWTWGALEVLSQEESVPPKRPFVEFPFDLQGHWKGREVGLDERVLAVLRLDDYMMRVYRRTRPLDGERRVLPGALRSDALTTDQDLQPIERVPRVRNVRLNTLLDEGEEAIQPVWLYVGYYQSQRTGVTYHSPKNCLPGAGWQIIDSRPLTIPVPDGRTITINNVLIQKGLDRQVILYWYHDRGRVIANEYWAKAYLIWDAITRNRTDGALVRISIPVVTTPESAVSVGVSFLQDLWPVLLRYMPDPPSPSF
ncbi:MAG: EpsI family protein [Nitrospirae bacterium]|nr:MAG: EpsI family protein [Nitrospirota bacterium]